MNLRQHTEPPLELAGTSTPKAAKKERKLLRKLDEIDADPTLTKKERKCQKREIQTQLDEMDLRKRTDEPVLQLESSNKRARDAGDADEELQKSKKHKTRRPAAELLAEHVVDLTPATKTKKHKKITQEQLAEMAAAADASDDDNGVAESPKKHKKQASAQIFRDRVVDALKKKKKAKDTETDA